MASYISLDEYAHQVRSEQSRAILREAVACINADCKRAAVINTWLAVTFDILEKLNSLSAMGDSAAQEVIDEFNNLRQREDWTGTTRFEQKLLDLC